MDFNMGVMDFVKDAGSAIGIGKSKQQEIREKAAKAKAAADLKKAQQARAAAARKATAASKAKKTAAERAKKVAERQKKAAAAEKVREEKKGVELEKHLTKMGLKGRGLAVTYDDGVAKVVGTVANRATKEKIILALGNVQGVSQVRDTLRVLPPKKSTVNTAAVRARRKAAAAAQTMHTVKSGDTLSKLAKKYLGDANRYPEIFKANQPMLTNPDMIQVGQVLRIPRK